MTEFDYEGPVKELRDIVKARGILPELTYSLLTPSLFSSIKGDELPRELSAFDDGDLVKLVWPEIILEMNLVGGKQ